MTKFTVFGGCFVLAAGLVCVAAYAFPALAAEGGYEGLIAPAAPDNTSSVRDDAPAGSTSGYEGVLAPSVPPAASAAHEGEPAGYEGVLPGRVAAPQITAIPGGEDIDDSDSRTDIRMLATIYGQDRDGDGVPDGIREPRKIEGTPAAQASIDGKPSMEYVAEQQVKQMMAPVTDKSISSEERAENVRMAQQQLGLMASGLRAKKDIPDKIYKKMGLSDEYIRQDKASNDSALARLNKALATLRKYQ